MGKHPNRSWFLIMPLQFLLTAKVKSSEATAGLSLPDRRRVKLQGSKEVTGKANLCHFTNELSWYDGPEVVTAYSGDYFSR